MSITSESWWGREVNPPTLVALGAKLRTHYKLTAGAIGIKGNTAHTQGYHRSANWVRNSAYCTHHTYSVVETPGNRNPHDGDWCCALDVTLPHDDLIAACKRLDEAVRAGRLEKVTEWYGNDDGDNRVDGYDNIRNTVASSDSSHLWHLHMSFDRGRVDEDHTDVFEILTGAEMDAKETGVAVWETDGVVKRQSAMHGAAAGTHVQGKSLVIRVFDEVATRREDGTSPPAGTLAAHVLELTAKVDQILAALAAGAPLPPPSGNTTATFTGSVEFKPIPPQD